MANDTKLLESAEGYLELGLPQPALDSLEQVSPTARKEDPFVYHSLAGEALRQLEQYAAAIDHLTKAQAERPTAIAIYIGLGWCHKRTNQLPEAIRVLEQAEEVARKLDVPSQLALVLYNLACYHSLAGQKGEMLSHLREALEIDPDYRQAIADESDFDPYRHDPDFITLSSEIL
jgi:tetratricopeptide (TPR) repeat protein